MEMKEETDLYRNRIVLQAEQMKGSSLRGRGACTVAVVQGAWRFSRVKRELLERKGLPVDVGFFVVMVSRPNSASECSHYYAGFLVRQVFLPVC